MSTGAGAVAVVHVVVDDLPVMKSVTSVNRSSPKTTPAILENCKEIATHGEVDNVKNKRNQRNKRRHTPNERGEQEADAVRDERGEEREEGDCGGDGVEDERAGDVVHGRGGGVGEGDVVHAPYDARNVVADGTA